MVSIYPTPRQGLCCGSRHGLGMAHVHPRCRVSRYHPDRVLLLRHGHCYLLREVISLGASPAPLMCFSLGDQSPIHRPCHYIAGDNKGKAQRLGTRSYIPGLPFYHHPNQLCRLPDHIHPHVHLDSDPGLAGGESPRRRRLYRHALPRAYRRTPNNPRRRHQDETRLLDRPRRISESMVKPRRMVSNRLLSHFTELCRDYDLYPCHNHHHVRSRP